MTFKRRSQLLIAAIVAAVSIVLTSYHISSERNHARERALHSSQNIKMALDSIVSDVEHYYIYRSYVTLRVDGVLDAIAARDTERLYRLNLPRYKALREENPYLIIMQFHASDGRSILRMHRKELFGDDIASHRAMLREVHGTHKIVSGFEGGIQGMAYRVAVPVMKEGVYIGALEFGIDTKYFIKMIKQATGSNGVLMIHESLLGAADTNAYKEGFGGYRYTAIQPEQRKIMDLFAHNNPMMQPRQVHDNKKDYEINPLFLKDARNRNVGVIVSINDVSGGNKNIIEMILESLLITAVMIAAFLGAFEYAFAHLLNKLNLQEQYIHTILDSQKNIVIVTDGKKIIYANQAFFDYFGYRNLDSFRQEHECICDYFEKGESNEYLLPQMDGILWTEYLLKHDSDEHKVKMTKNGETSIFTVHSEMMQYQNEVRHVVVFTDVTMLNKLATQDALTQVANRFQFDKVLEHSISISGRYGRPLSMLLIDIDHFKNINDHYGHLIGDEVLKQIARLLSENIRKSDSVARWGGEEFVILLPDSDLLSAYRLAEILRARIEADDFSPVETVTCSIGIAQWEEGEHPDALLSRVDAKLYAAKEGGRNRVVY